MVHLLNYQANIIYLYIFMHIIGYFLAVLIGVSLGLLGSGGSILTVPLLVYFFGVDPMVATSYSLLLVGTISGVGSVMRFKQGQVDLRIVGLFGMSSVVTVLLSRMFLLPAIPELWVQIGSFILNKSTGLMLLFSLLLLGSAYFILTGPMHFRPDRSIKSSSSRLLLYGIGIGLITGILGAGGGFLIVPVLMLLFRCPIHVAAGTSLAIITLNMLLGFLGDIGRITLDWNKLLILLVITLAGLIMGQYLSQHINGQKLSNGFGWFLLCMSIFILIMELKNLTGAIL